MGAWNYLFDEATDERTRGWFLVGSPIPIFSIMVVYYIFIKKVGPAFMLNRKPYKLDKIIQVYNLFQVVSSAWLAYQSFTWSYGHKGTYNWSCQPLGSTKSEADLMTAKCAWIYYMMKVLDLLDTVFFTLRKKYNQVTFLHFYHHGAMLLLGYLGTTYWPDGQGILLISLNSLVHTFMYFYYFLSSYSEKYKQNTWWKKYITQMQIAQFLFLFYHFSKLLFKKDCAYPALPVRLMVPQILLMLVLFSNFYYKTYINPRPKLKTP